MKIPCCKYRVVRELLLSTEYGKFDSRFVSCCTCRSKTSYLAPNVIIDSPLVCYDCTDYKLIECLTNKDNIE